VLRPEHGRWPGAAAVCRRSPGHAGQYRTAGRHARQASASGRPRLAGAWIVLAVWALAAVILAVTTVYRRDV